MTTRYVLPFRLRLNFDSIDDLREPLDRAKSSSAALGTGLSQAFVSGEKKPAKATLDGGVTSISTLEINLLAQSLSSSAFQVKVEGSRYDRFGPLARFRQQRAELRRGDDLPLDTM